MKQIVISENEAGQRLSKFLCKYMPNAPVSFFYKMLRKKNITVNNKKQSGNEILKEQDEIQLYLSEDTILNFQQANISCDVYLRAYHSLCGISIVYENSDILIMNKPVGILTQKADEKDASLNEWMIGYLIETGKQNAQSLKTFHPSVLNRLDRNTIGLVIASKTLKASQLISALIHDHKIQKFYRMLVIGTGIKEQLLKGYITKDALSNKVSYSKTASPDASYIETHIYPLREYSDFTLVEAELITGKSHQIRYHLASVGFPLIGDYKYGNTTRNEYYKKKYHITSQLLYAYKLHFPELDEPFKELSNLIITAPEPDLFKKLTEDK